MLKIWHHCRFKLEMHGTPLQSRNFYWIPWPCPWRKRLSCTHALRGMQHPGGELVKLEIYGFNESGTVESSLG